MTAAVAEAEVPLPAPAAAPLLSVEGLTVTFDTPRGPLTAVQDVSFAVPKGKTLGLVGESGSGKTVSASAVMRLLTAKLAGKIVFEGRDLLALGEAEMRGIRGQRIGMIFQDPMASLNPAHRIGEQVTEPLKIHRKVSSAALRDKAVELLAKVGIPEPAERAKAYPHELSGGMRQRAMIAMALACEPALVIADEPTTALDVTIQAQIVDLLLRLQRENGMGILLITHDLGLVAEACDEVAVMYAGRVMERGPAAQVLENPLHPYTAGLRASTPVPRSGVDRLREIPGIVPDLRSLPSGCRFQTRCPAAQDRCRSEEPPLVTLGPGREARCHFPLGGAR